MIIINIRKNADGKRFVEMFLPMLAVFSLPFFIILIAVFGLSPVYNDTFVGELGDKYERLNTVDSPKIVIIGGSSAAFGLDSEMIEEHLGYETVNFGLYANLGTKLMMDLSKSSINEGDIIILAPEMNSQTLSLYFNPETTAQALDGNLSMLKDIDRSDIESLIGSMWKTASSKLVYTFTETKPQNAGAYKKENFNEYGDNVFDRPYNEQNGYGNDITLNFHCDPNDDAVSEYEEYISYVNEYVDYAEKKGAKVYFSFPPMNERALEKSNSLAQIEEFYINLNLSLNCKVISNIYDYILDDGYFFDSEFHLNNSGVVIRTVRLIDDIKRELGITTVTVPEYELPEPSGHRPKEYVQGDTDASSPSDSNIDCLIIEITDNEYCTIVGMSDEGKLLTEFTIPEMYEGLPITNIAENAFADSSLVTLTLGNNIMRLDGGALRGTVIESLIIPDGVGAEDISVPNNMSECLATDGCKPGLRIFVDKDKFSEFAADYFWGDYGAYITEKD